MRRPSWCSASIVQRGEVVVCRDLHRYYAAAVIDLPGGDVVGGLPIGRQDAPALLELVERPRWMADALCAEYDRSLWFPELGETAAEARAICDRCLVRDECLAFALESSTGEHGIWGGRSRQERQRMRRGAA